jgi:hypothetical protein
MTRSVFEVHWDSQTRKRDGNDEEWFALPVAPLQVTAHRDKSLREHLHEAY